MAQKTTTHPKFAAKQQQAFMKWGMGNGLDHQLMDTMLKIQSNNAKRMIEMNEEILRFAMQRLRVDENLMSALSKNGRGTTVAEAWGNFFSNAVSDYADEYRKLWSMYLEQTTNGFEETQKEVFEALNTVIEVTNPQMTEHTPV